MLHLRAKKGCWDIIKRYYPKYEGKYSVIHSIIGPYLKRDIVLLDAGCGRGAGTVARYKDRVKLSLGMDISESIKFNNKIHYAIRADVCNIPLADAIADLIISQELIEHLEMPKIYLKEICRVLKPKGVFVFSTPNLLSWKSILSLLTPYSLHIKLNKELHGIDKSDIFPTYYKMNRFHKINKFMQKNGLVMDKLIMWEGTPRTLTFSRLTTYIDILITTALRRHKVFEKYREIIVASYKKIS